MATPAAAVRSPFDQDADVLLRTGSTVRVRAVHPADEARLAAFFRSLSRDSRALRFCAAVGDDFLDRAAQSFAKADGADSVGLVATAGPGQRIVGHATYVVTAPDRAEVAFAIADDQRDQGLGTLLLGELAQVASARGIRVFEAVVLPENYRMLTVFRESGFPVRADTAPGEIHVEFPTELSKEALERFEQREWTAAVNAVRGFFSPGSVAVIGASRQRPSIGGEVLHNLLSSRFAGPVFPVNPNASTVQGLTAYPGVENVPGPVDLAVIAVPAARVLDVAAACGRKGVRNLVVMSAGFAEMGDDGRARQRELVRVCRTAGMRLMGPNCMGVLNTDPSVRLNATFAPEPPPRGRLAFMSQSGALGLAIIDYAHSLGLGLSTFASVGNKADISTNDLLRYWERDPNTDAILLYLESFGNPRKFSRIARRVARSRPIVAVKSGRSPAGARAAGSHTGALLAASDVTVDALFRQAGVIRTDTLEEMFDVATLLSSQPPPRGRRAAILSNAGGPAILCADACIAEGLEVPPLSEESKAALHQLLPSEASVTNPVDMIASAPAAHYREAIRILERDPNVDALIVIFIPPMVTRPEDAAQAIVDSLREHPRGKPLLTVFMRSCGAPVELRAADVSIPCYAFPEDAAVALARVARYGEWLARPPASPPRFDDVRQDEATSIVASALDRGAGWLPPDAIRQLLACYGIPVLDERMAVTPDEAGREATALGEAVALKAIVPGVLHKTDLGAVRLNLRPEHVTSIAREMEERLRSVGRVPTGFLVQRMAPPGREMILGVVHDRQFGPVLACGAGGVLVELVKDVSVRLTPVVESEAMEMLRELKTYPLLTGYRGEPACDVPALVQAILRISAMVEDLPQIMELDLNPILVHPRGVSIVDARVRVAPAEPAPPLGALSPSRR
jgi:acetyl coenzyme A synthetase (ADP forming)-like protein